MKPDLLVESRSALLDALQALDQHRDAVTIVGAQAIYLRTSAAPVALAEATKDSDLVLDPRLLLEDPRVEVAMTDAGFYRNPVTGQPGAWMNPGGVPVDLMVPDALAGAAGRRSVRIPPHDREVARRARGLEAAIVDNSVMRIESLDPADLRSFHARVAGPAALLIAKLHKLAERVDTPTRLVDKDAHDSYRILIDVETELLVHDFETLLRDEVSRDVTVEAIDSLKTLFADGPGALGSHMAGRAEEGIGEPDTVSASVSALASDLHSSVVKLLS